MTDGVGPEIGMSPPLIGEPTEDVMITVAGYTRGEGWGSGHGRRHRRRASGEGRRGVIDA
jgi:hypothetical protein